MIIAVDGTLASGKGTLAKRLARHYDLAHLDTGLLYRATGYLALRAKIDAEDGAQLAALAQTLDLHALDESLLRTQTVGEMASRVAKIPAVREALLNFQRNFAAQDGGAVLDGRDIGTVICPNANFKFWVDATDQIRAKRRHIELIARGDDTHSFEDVLNALRVRDSRDAGRADAPMTKAVDAYILDTTDLNADEVFSLAISHISTQR